MADLFALFGGPLVIFYSIAILASFFLVVQIILMAFGVGDGDVDLDVGDGLDFFSVRSLTGFFGGFGWAGVIMLENGSSLIAATGVGVVAGSVLMLSVAYLMKVLYSLKESGTIDLNNAVGQTGTVYLTIPHSESGAGKVRVMVQGRLKIVAACTTSREPIPTERKVTVQGLLDPTTLLVEPLAIPAAEE